MSYTYAVLLQLAIPLFLGLAVMAYLRGITGRLLLDMCGTKDRAEFWVRVTTILVAATPLSLVLVFGTSPTTNLCQGAELPADNIIRNAVSWSLVGILLALGLVSRGIWRQIPKPASAIPSQTEGA